MPRDDAEAAGVAGQASPHVAGGGTMPGFANHLATEAVAGALPVGRNSPQHVPYGL